MKYPSIFKTALQGLTYEITSCKQFALEIGTTYKNCSKSETRNDTYKPEKYLQLIIVFQDFSNLLQHQRISNRNNPYLNSFCKPLGT